MANSQTLSPQRPYILVPSLGSMMYRWERYGLSDSSITKMLALWHGWNLRDLMDSQGRWTKSELFSVAKRLGYKTTRLLLDDVVRARAFFIVGEADDSVSLISSPIWHWWEEADGKLLTGSASPKTENGAENGAVIIFIILVIIIIILPEVTLTRSPMEWRRTWWRRR